MNVQSIGNNNHVDFYVHGNENQQKEKKQTEASLLLKEDILTIQNDITNGTVKLKYDSVANSYNLSTSNVYSTYSTSTTNTNKIIQTRLQQLGFYNGVLDGKLTSTASKKAITNFQRVYGLSQTGTANTNTQKKLNDAISVYRVTASKSDLINITKMPSGYSDYKENDIRENFAKAWAFFKVGMGLTDRQASGVLGNIMAESGCCSDNAQDSKGYGKLHDTNYKYDVNDNVGYGILQWTMSCRKKGLNDTAQEMGLKVSDLNAQFAYFRLETKTDTLCKSAWNELKKYDMIDASTSIFLNEIEMPEVRNFEERYSIARKIFSIMG